MPLTQDDITFMSHAIEEARKSTSEEGKLSPKVGAVVVKDGKLLVAAFRGELRAGDHAEYTAIKKKAAGLGLDLAGATVYTTLEPCTERNPPKTPCYQHLLDHRVKRVVVGMLDPDGRIAGKGAELLRDAGVEVELATSEQARAIKDINAAWVAQYDEGRRPWRELVSMRQPRERHAAVAFRDGVLVIGGSAGGAAAALATCELYAGPRGEWEDAPTMLSARTGHTATVLQDGSVLVTGGFNADGKYLSMTELLSPGGIEWTRADGDMHAPRFGHTATLLSDGRVLVCGGYYHDRTLDEAVFVRQGEVFDPATKRWHQAGDLLTPRDGHSASLLPDGRVLVVGGRFKIPGSGRHLSLVEVEVFDPKENRFGKAPNSLAEPRARHAALTLKSGILVAGGADQCCRDAYAALDSAELLDFETLTWKRIGNLRACREAPLLFDTDAGAPVLIGGFTGDGGIVSSTERFDAVGEAWVDGPTMGVPRYCAQAVRVPVGRGVLVSGGLAVGSDGRAAQPTARVELFQH